MLRRNVIVKNDTLVVADRPEQRYEILNAVAGMACKSTDLLAPRKEQGRDFVKDSRVVYVYHRAARQALKDRSPAAQELGDSEV